MTHNSRLADIQALIPRIHALYKPRPYIDVLREQRRIYRENNSSSVKNIEGIKFHDVLGEAIDLFDDHELNYGRNEHLHKNTVIKRYGHI